MEFITPATITTINVVDHVATSISSITASAGRGVQRIAAADTTAWAAAIERTIRASAVVFAFLFVIGSITAEALFSIGGQFRRALDDRNDQLGAFWVRLWVAKPIASGAIVLVPAPAPAAASAVYLLPVFPILLAAPAAPFALLAPAAPVKAPRRRSAAKPAASSSSQADVKPRPARRARRAAVAMVAA